MSFAPSDNPDGGLPKIYIEEGPFAGVIFSYDNVNVEEKDDGTFIVFDPIFYFIPTELDKSKLESDGFKEIAGNILNNCLVRFIEDEIIN
jgi:hypothetical protein